MKFQSQKGSITIEAVISMTVFVAFTFLLLSIIKLTVTDIVLNNITSETAKQIANSSYPIQLINNVQDEADDKADDTIQKYGGVTLEDGLKNIAGNTISEILFSGSVDGAKAQAKDGINKVFDLLKAEAWENIEKYIGSAKKTGVNYIVSKIMDSYISNSSIGIDRTNLTVEFAKIPQTENEYEYIKTNSSLYAQTGLTIDDIGIDDTVIAVKYNYKMALPFMPVYNIVLREVAVEKSWIKGSNGVVTSTKEGINLNVMEFINKFITQDREVFEGAKGHSKKYHTKDCPTLKAKGAKPIVLKDALKKGLSPCLTCHPDDNINKGE